MSESYPPDPEGTIRQPDEAQAQSQELSIPKGVEQNPSAPRIDGYLLTHPLGRGAYAQVWKAWQVRTHKWVAMKVFLDRGGVNWLFLQRELERLIRLDKHPHIVSLLDADMTADPAYYVMDYMEGGSLEKFVDPARLVPVDKAAAWMAEIAQALSYVHAKGLIHCDLKPANVLLDDEGHVRVADFGQSRIVTESSGALGTLFYMAPEQAVTIADGAQLQPDVRWDVYGLGTTMWAVLTGKVPHGEEANRKLLEGAKTLEERLKVYREAVSRRALEEPSRVTGGRVDQDLSAIVTKCASGEPAARHSTTAEVLADLDARLHDAPVSSLYHSRWYRLSKFVRRNIFHIVGSGLAESVHAFFLLMAGFLVCASVQLWAVARYQRDQAALEEKSRKYQAVTDYYFDELRRFIRVQSDDAAQAARRGEPPRIDNNVSGAARNVESTYRKMQQGELINSRERIEAARKWGTFIADFSVLTYALLALASLSLYLILRAVMRLNAKEGRLWKAVCGLLATAFLSSLGYWLEHGMEKPDIDPFFLLGGIALAWLLLLGFQEKMTQEGTSPTGTAGLPPDALARGLWTVYPCLLFALVGVPGAYSLPSNLGGQAAGLAFSGAVLFLSAVDLPERYRIIGADEEWGSMASARALRGVLWVFSYGFAAQLLYSLLNIGSLVLIALALAGASTFVPLPTAVNLPATLIAAVAAWFAFWRLTRCRTLIYGAFGLEAPRSKGRFGPLAIEAVEEMTSTARSDWASGLRAIAFVSALTLACGLVILRSHQVWHQRVDALKTELRAAGWPASLADFQDSPPSNEYAETRFYKALAALDYNALSLDQNKKARPGIKGIQKWDEPVFEVNKDLQARYQALVADGILPLKAYRRMFRVDYPAAALNADLHTPRFALFISAAQLMKLFAGNDAYRGDLASAWEAVEAIGHLAFLSSTHPSLIAKMIALAQRGIAARSAINVMLTKPESSIPETLDTQMESWLTDDLVLAAYRGELAKLLDFREAVEKGRFIVGEDPSTMRVWSASILPARSIGLVDTGCFELASQLHRLLQARTWSALKTGWPRFLETSSRLREWPYFLSKGVLSSRLFSFKADLLLLSKKEFAIRDWVRLALTFSALNGYRQAHGRYPDRLADLGDKVAVGIAVDSFNGRPFEYSPAQEGKAFDLCSPGEDGARRDSQGATCVHLRP